MKKIWHSNGLSIVLVVITVLSLLGQTLTGWFEHNGDLADFGRQPLGLAAYLQSGHFIEATFENWESEFLQMGLYIVLTIKLFQRGSSESKDPDKVGQEEVDREPDPTRRGAAAAVKAGGWRLCLYQNSLSFAFFALFLLSFWLHAIGGVRQHNLEQVLRGKPSNTTLLTFMSGSSFWFQSLQNWQSEFLSVLAIVVLSIFLRQKGSPESKPVDAANDETGN